VRKAAEAGVIHLGGRAERSLDAIRSGRASLAATTGDAASGGFQYCYYKGGFACLNAWGGGPLVNVYAGGPDGSDNNADFTEIYSVDGETELEFTGGGSYSGECVGDAYNLSGRADTGLDSCGSTTTDPGWGTLFYAGTTGCPVGDVWFYNYHWKGYLGPPDNYVNGSPFYLDNEDYACFSLTGVID
jgi:hypothetical protein